MAPAARDSGRWLTVGSPPGLLDINGDGNLEIIATRLRVPGGDFDATSNLIALHHDGTLAWPGDGGSEAHGEDYKGYAQRNTYTGPSFADLDGDGNVEIILPWSGSFNYATKSGFSVYNAIDGSIKWEYLGEAQGGNSNNKPIVIADLNLDGKLEIISHTSVVDHEGNLKFRLPVEDGGSAITTHLHSAVANFDNDPYPEIVARDSNSMYMFKHDGTLVWKVDKKNRVDTPITVADFNGDGVMNFAFLGGDYSQWTGATPRYIEVYKADGSPLWSHQNRKRFHDNYDNHEGITAWDANGDGIADIVIYNQLYRGGAGVMIYDGRNGELLEHLPIRRYGTAPRFMTVADVDGDGEAELISSWSNGLGGDTVVYKGARSKPLPRAPSNRNQWIFTEGYTDDQGNTLSNVTPHWLRPGLNGYNLIAPAPHPLAGTTDSFTYKANDGALDSNVATVTFDVQPAGTPPVFLSRPDTLTTVGFQYRYAPQVIDSDPGDTVSFMLTAAPSGMTIDAGTGVVSWVPAAVGEYSVGILASDTIGFATPQIYVLTVGEPVVVPDLIGQTEVAAGNLLTAENLLVGNKGIATHPSIAAGSISVQAPVAGSVAEFGSAVNLIISAGPGPEDIDSDGDGFTPNEGDCNDNDASIYPGAIDIPGDGIDQDCDGIDGNLTLSEILVLPKVSTVLTDQIVKLKAVGIFEDGTSQNLTGVVDWSDGPDFKSATAGDFTVTATRGSVSSAAEVHVVARVSGDTVPPVAEITAPGTGDTITAPIDVLGTASDANFLKYELAIALAGEAEFTLLGSSNSPVAGGVLGQLDPTLLINDLYTLRLTVYDTGGNELTEEVTVQVSKNLKVGNFSLNFLDLEIPLSGIALRANRTYDSRDKHRGDFGYGWNLDINTLRLRTNRVLGTGWEVIKSGLSYGLIPTDEHKVSITLPGDRVAEFDLSVTPTTSPIVPFPPLANRASYVARPGTTGKLVSLDNNNLSILDSQPGEIELRDDTSNVTYNPQLYRYTAADGTEIDISVTGGVKKIRKPDGNTISITSAGITHSSGKSIQFMRDSLGRITELVDANGNSQFYSYDGNGDLRTYEDREGYVTRFDYNLDHGLLRVIDPLGRVISRNEYDDDGRLISVTNADGHAVTIAHDLDARQEVITDEAGGITVMDYDDDGNVLRQIDALGGITTNTYDADGNQTSTTNAEGESTSRSFDVRGNKLSETNAEGETTQFTYDGKDNVTSVTDPLGRVVHLEFDSAGQLLRQINALGQVQHQSAYDSAGNLIANTDASGNTRQYSYDAFGNQVATTDARGNQSTLSYDANGYVTSEADRLGSIVQGQVDARGKITSATNPLGDAASFDYNYAGTLVAQTTAGGITDTIDFNALGQQTTYSNGAGETLRRTYDSRGNLKTVTNANNQVTTYTYDALSRRTGITQPDGAIRQFEYDGVGRLVKETDAQGNATRYVYDDAGRNTRITNALGEVTRFEYDVADNLIRKIDAKGNVFEYEYDALDRLVLTRFPDATTTTVSHDANGNVVSETDEAGGVTQYGYDANDNLISVEKPTGEINSYVYNHDDHLIAQVDGLGHETSFEYDATGQLKRKTWPDGTSEQYSYDTDGNLINMTDGNGKQTDYSYDVVGRLTLTTFDDGSSESYTYTSTGRIATSSNHLGNVSYSYDTNDRVVNKTNPDGSFIEYSYDLNGNQTEVSAGLSGQPARSTDYTYDALNRLATVTDADGHTTSYSYDAIGNLLTTNYPNGVVSTFEYDSKSRLTRLSHENSGGVFERYDYTVDAVGNRIRVVSLDSSYIDYKYDLSRRLLKESHYDALASKVFGQSFSYDLVGNRSSRLDQIGNQINYVYNTSDQLISAGSTSYNYDANGNLVSRQSNAGLTRYTWSLEDQLSGVQTSSDQVDYAYDAEGERVSRSLNSSTTRFLVDGNSVTGYSQSLVDYTGTQTSLSEYTYGQRLIGQNRGGVERFHHRDGSQNVRLLTDSTGSVTDTYNYDAFGNKLSQTGSSSNQYQFAGDRFAEPEELLYLRARYYDPDSSRFISRDPFEGILRDSESLHRYLYANSNPVVFIDPGGQFPTLTGTMVTSAISGALISGTIAAISGKGPAGIITDALIGGAFGAVGGPLGNALGKAFQESKILISLVRNPAVMRFSGRFVAAIPTTILGAVEDLSKALANGDAYKSSFPANLLKTTFLNFVFNTILGPNSVETEDLYKLVGTGAKGAGAAYSRHGIDYYHIFKDPVMKVVPSGRAVLAFVSHERAEALEFLAGFMWEFTKLMTDELPEFIGKNE